MTNELIQNLREYLKANDIDYLLVNTCDEFLLEYNQKEFCARYWVTNFTGSTGEALLSQDALYLFVDGRYHIQADNEVNKQDVTVVKLRLGESFSDALVSKIPPNATLAIIPAKLSLSLYNLLRQKLGDKNIQIKLMNQDPVFHFIENNGTEKYENLQQVSSTISGCEMDDKLKRARHYLADNECFLFTKLEDIAYMTNLRGYKIPYSSTFKAKFLLSKTECMLFTDEYISDLGCCEVKPLSAFQGVLDKFAEKYKIIFEPSSINLECYNCIKDNAVELSANEGEHVFNFKSVKNKSELEHYKDAYKRTDAVVEYISELVNGNEDFSEFDLAQIVEEQYKAHGAVGLSFKTIMAIGENTAIIHYTRNSKDKKLRDGDLVLLDCGGYFEGGYATDITRTFVRGNPTDFQKNVYTTVLKGFLLGYNYQITLGTTGEDIDRITRETIDAEQIEGFSFAHGSGHGVGIGVHEGPPYVSQSKFGKYVLKPNMIFSIEPGLYKEGWGGVRLENVVYVDDSEERLKLTSLSNAKFEEKLIDYGMLDNNEKDLLKKWQNG